MIATPEREVVIEPIVRPELPELGVTPVARHLIATAMLLERDGWCKGAAGRSPNQRCLGSALMWCNIALSGEPRRYVPEADWLRTPWDAELQEVWAFVQAYLSYRYAMSGNLVAYNDQPSTTKELVIELLTGAAREAARYGY